MIPVLFAENATTFNTNGIGRLSDAISCVVTEERNGQYELEMEYPKSGKYYSEIGIRSLIVVKPSAKANNLQAFRVYSITKPIGGKVTVFAQHISYDLSKNVAMPFAITASASACNLTLQGLKSHAVETCPFTFQTDVTTVASYAQSVPASIRQRLGGTEGSVLDQFGGEYEWDNFTVHFWKNRGVEKDITLRYGKNITDLKQEENIANTITGVVPFWINTDKTETVTLPEKAVFTSNASRYSSKLTIPLDLSTEFEEKPTAAQLRTKAQIYVNREGMGLPKVSIKLSFVDLSQTEEYKSLLPFQEVNLCDTIKVQFEELGVDTTAKVVETEYDVLGERYNSIQVGSLKSTLATTINDMNASMALSIQDTGERVYADVNTEVSDLIDNATAWLTSSGGYVIAVKNPDGTWKELLFMDTNDITTAHNVLRINENGLGFSRNGVGGPYTQAWTLDGKLVVGGTNVPSITCYDSNNRIVFQASASGAIFNNGVITLKDTNDNVIFQASSSGVVVNSGVITLKNGNNLVFQASSSGVVVNSGVITLKNGNNLVFKASSAGVVWNATNSQMDQSGKLTANNATIQGTVRAISKSDNTYFMELSNAQLVGYSNNTVKGYIEINSSGDMTIYATDGIWQEALGGMDIRANDYIKLRQGTGMDVPQIEMYEDNIVLSADEIHLNGEAYIKDGVTRTFQYKNEDGNTSWIEFRNGVCVDWG